MEEYYVKAKHLATVRKIDVHKGEQSCEGFWKGGSMIFSIIRITSSRTGWCQNSIQ